jgi:hypothetical protein
MEVTLAPLVIAQWTEDIEKDNVMAAAPAVSRASAARCLAGFNDHAGQPPVWRRQRLRILWSPDERQVTVKYTYLDIKLSRQNESIVP